MLLSCSYPAINRWWALGLWMLLAMIIIVPRTAISQSSIWSVHLGAGQGYYAGDLSAPATGWPTTVDWAWHAGLYRQLGRRLDLGLRFESGRWYANDSDYDDALRSSRALRFTTSYTAVTFPLQYRILSGNIVPYIALGPGLLWYRAKGDYTYSRFSDLYPAYEEDAEASSRQVALQLHGQAGVDWRINPRYAIGIACTASHAFTDYLDGFSAGADPTNRDWYGTAECRLRYRFGTDDKDGDGIKDKIDRCPTLPGLAALQGCPDSDGDGIADQLDRCPLLAGPTLFSGCPDTDGDQVPDYLDSCPDQVGTVSRNGCPELRLDTDRDGIEDAFDICPTEYGPAERGGCPAIDSDQDGLLDEDDHCPYAFGLPIFFGCPDTDGDGIADDRDACPTLFGDYDTGGCPATATTAEWIALLNGQELHFAPQKEAILNPVLLDKMGTVLSENARYGLKIIVHDLATASQTLATQRAYQVFQYLTTRQAVTPDRITYEYLKERGTAPLGRVAVELIKI